MKKVRLIGLASVLTVCLLTGCGSSAATDTARYEKNMEAVDMATDNVYSEEAPAAAEAESMDTGTSNTAGEGGQANAVASNRKLIRIVNMDVETADYDTLIQNVDKRIKSCGGYVENSNIGKNNDYGFNSSRYASYTIRVPKDKLDEFVSEVSDKSNVISKTENTDDVTLQYVDTESHIKALETEEKRLLEFMEQASTVEEMLSIESRLTDVRYQIESYSSQIRTYDNQVDFSTVNLNISEVVTLTPQVEPGMGEQMRQGFMNSAVNIGKGLRNLLVALVVFLPYLVLFAIIGAIGLFLYKKISKIAQKKERERIEKRQQERDEAARKEAERKAAQAQNSSEEK